MTDSDYELAKKIAQEEADYDLAMKMSSMMKPHHPYPLPIIKPFDFKNGK
jgi:hypothetical protein